MEPIITAVGLAKSYAISHKATMRADYGTLKDDIASLIKRPFGGGNDGDTAETFWALKDVSFEVQRGEVFGVIGENGSGKSTLLKILSRIVEPTRGSVHLRGRTASLLEVGTGFHPELTGRENIFFNGSMLGMSRAEIRHKFDEIVAFSEIEKFLDTPVKFYSSGMYVRLAFSVAAHLEPEILILDEVLAVGDAGFQAKSLAKITSTMEQGRTVLFVSHSMGAVTQLCNRGILLKKGKVAFAGPADELVEEYTVQTVGKQFSAEAAKLKDKPVKTDHFKVLGLSLRDKAGHEIDSVMRASDEVYVHIDLDITKPDDNLVVGYALQTEAGTMLYGTYSADATGLADGKLPKGKLTLVGSLPKRLLNTGGYKLSLMASIFNQSWIYEPGGDKNPSLNFLVSKGLPHEKLWKEPREGFLAPAIDWELQKR